MSELTIALSANQFNRAHALEFERQLHDFGYGTDWTSNPEASGDGASSVSRSLSLELLEERRTVISEADAVVAANLSSNRNIDWFLSPFNEHDLIMAIAFGKPAFLLGDFPFNSQLGRSHDPRRMLNLRGCGVRALRHDTSLLVAFLSQEVAT